MAGFLIAIAVLIICCLLFGKADTKKDILNEVGLDLSQSNYEDKKVREFQKYALKAMNAIIDLDSYYANSESDFLNYLEDKLQVSIWGGFEEDSFGDLRPKSLYLGVKKHYVMHAYRVIIRRKDDIKNGNTEPLSKTVNFADKKSAKKYCEKLWEKYQYPWPEDWMQRDSM